MAGKPKKEEKNSNATCLDLNEQQKTQKDGDTEEGCQKPGQ